MITNSKIRIIPAAEAADVFHRRESQMALAEEAMKPIIEAVRLHGDEALREYAKRFDCFEDHSFIALRDELTLAERSVSEGFRAAVKQARANIEAFARLQMPAEFRKELAPGHVVGQILRPIERVAAYIPGGRYPLPSTVLMTTIPAQVAGVPDIWVTTPKYNREVYAAASLCGVRNVAKLGGGHAIAAFAFGTETIPKATRIVGPGNVYVSAAKKLLSGEVGIDFVAGPTEVLIVANEGNPKWIAADMLAQAEHDVEAASILVTISPSLAGEVAEEIELQLASLSTAETARVAIERNGAIILTDSNEQSMEISNRFAPEHLSLHHPELLPMVLNAGSVFLGPLSPEAAGDYATGPNHVLPTAGAANLQGGLSVLQFLKVITIQELDADALRGVGKSAITLARAEGLEAHARSIEVRQNG